jgi:hypothetical protein
MRELRTDSFVRMTMSWPGEDSPPSPVAPVPDETHWSPKFAMMRVSGQHELEPAFRCPPHRNARLRIVKQNEVVVL